MTETLHLDYIFVKMGQKSIDEMVYWASPLGGNTPTTCADASSSGHASLLPVRLFRMPLWKCSYVPTTRKEINKAGFNPKFLVLESCCYVNIPIHGTHGQKQKTTCPRFFTRAT